MVPCVEILGLRNPTRCNIMQICFGRPSRPSSGVNKAVVAAFGTDRTIWGASFLKHDEIRTVPEAATTNFVYS